MRDRPEKPVRFGVVGVGAVSRRHVPPFLQRPETVRLAAVCDPNRDAAQAFAEQVPGGARIWSDHRELLDADVVDAVIIAIPHHLHAAVASDFVRSGIPVLVEKPLACTLDEVRQLRDLSHAHNVPVVAGQMRRFNREAVWLRRWAQRPGSFGALRTFDVHSWQNISAYVRGGTDHWLLDGEQAGGGVIISLAVHQLDLVRYITGCDYAEVYAHGHYDPPFRNGAESAAVVSLTMDSGAFGVVHASYVAPRVPYSEAMTLFGERGAIVQRVERIGHYLGPFHYASAEGRETDQWEHQFQGFEAVPVAEVAELSEDPFVNQLEHFASCLHEGRTPANDVDENLNTMACLQAIHDSLRSGRPEAVARS